MDLVLKGRIFDGTNLHQKYIVKIDSDKGIITAVGERGSTEERTPGRDSKTLQYRENTTIIPGLIDTHVHFFGAQGSGINAWATVPDALAVLRSVSDLRKLLHAGFTTVRELGTKSGALLARAANEGYLESPRIVSCSRTLSQTGGDDDPTDFPIEIAEALASYTYFCDGEAECRAAVRRVVRDGGRCVKLYASGGFAQRSRVTLHFTKDELAAIVDEAHRSGLKVAAHAYGEEAILNIIHSGVDSIEHGLGLTARTAKMIRDKGIFYVPTLVAYLKADRMVRKGDETSLREGLIQRHFSEDMQIAKKYGLKVTMGSDIVGDSARPHGRNYEEIVEEAKFIGNREAVIAATSRAAECLDLPNVGKIQENFTADIVVVRGNPLEDIESLSPENVLQVIKSGRTILTS